MIAIGLLQLPPLAIASCLGSSPCSVFLFHDFDDDDDGNDDNNKIIDDDDILSKNIGTALSAAMMVRLLLPLNVGDSEAQHSSANLSLQLSIQLKVDS